MRKLLLGLLVGGVATWMFRSRNARDYLGQKSANAPAPVRQRAESLAVSTASGVDRLAAIVEAAPLPRQIKDSAGPVIAAARSATDAAREKTHAAAPEPAQTEGTVAEPVSTGTPADVLAEQDAGTRAAAEALQEKQSGA